MLTTNDLTLEVICGIIEKIKNIFLREFCIDACTKKVTLWGIKNKIISKYLHTLCIAFEREAIMSFLSAYKKPDNLCKDFLQSETGVTTYINTMEQLNRSYFKPA